MEPATGGTTRNQPTTPAPQAAGAALIPALTVLSHPDLVRIGDRAFLSELVRGREALLSRKGPRFAAPGAPGSEPLDDPYLSRTPLRLEPRPEGGLRFHRNGCQAAVTVDGRTLDESLTLSAESLSSGVVLALAERVVLWLNLRRSPSVEPLPRCGLVGESAGLEEVRRTVARLAGIPVPVLVRGATGTGKELVARALHEQGPRAGGPFVGVNLGSLPPSLAAAELFGARRGAFTGSVGDTPGYFLRAHGGTLLLDEIGEAAPEIQVMLLRALETGEIVPVGAQAPRRVDVRVVAATDADLEAAVERGTFRAPLLHRLAGYTVRLPPLVERREDLGRLLIHFLAQELGRIGEGLPRPDPNAPHPWIPAELMVHLALHAWPGNVRELANVARQLAIDGRGHPCLPARFSLPVQSGAAASPASPLPGPPASPQPRRKPSQVGVEEMLAAVAAHRWNLKAAAEELGIARTSLYVLLERSGRLRPAADLTPDEIRQAFERCGQDVEATAAALEVSIRALRQRLKDLGLRS